MWLSPHTRLPQNNPEREASKTHLKDDGKSGMHQSTWEGHHHRVSPSMGPMQVWRALCIKHSNVNQRWSLQAPRALAPPDRDASGLQQNLEARMTLLFTSLMNSWPGVSDSHLLCLRLLSPCPASLGTIEQSLLCWVSGTGSFQPPISQTSDLETERGSFRIWTQDLLPPTPKFFPLRKPPGLLIV